MGFSGASTVTERIITPTSFMPCGLSGGSVFRTWKLLPCFGKFSQDPGAWSSKSLHSIRKATVHLNGETTIMEPPCLLCRF